MNPARFSGLIGEAGLRPEALTGEADVLWVTADSRTCLSGSVFVCMPSRRTDSHLFLSQAMKAGATACVVHTREGFESAVALGFAVAWISPDQPRFNEQVGLLARELLGDPSAQMRVIGVTGTNGKTTTVWMLRDALRALGRRAAYLGTLGFDADGALREIPNTTPFPVETWQLLHEATEAGVQDFVMEASSHALAERRPAGVRFEVGVFTNLSQDHLDFHGTMERYEDAKLLLFTEFAERAGSGFRSAINIGDPVGRKWADRMPATVTFGAPGADLECRATEVSVDSIELYVSFRGDDHEFCVGVGGQFNVWNAAATVATLLAMGFALDEIAGAMDSVTPVPGRFESVQTGRGFGVIVDYAHTEDALEKLLESARQLGPNRIITVFGCGGDRDRAKRPKMARAASENSDITIVTSDNPRNEDPLQILHEVEQGLVAGKRSESMVDRRAAIQRAIDLAEQGDIVVIAGKGHEDYQIVGDTKHPMDDRAMAREALEALPR